MDARQTSDFVDRKWESEIVPQLVDYIRIPNKSPMFDADWVANGHMERAVGSDGSVGTRASRFPACSWTWCDWKDARQLIFIDIPASGADVGEDCVLLYGHLDKQPEMTGWDDGPRPVGTRAEGRQAVRPRRRRRRLRDLRLAGRDHGAAGTGCAARTLRGVDRSLRGIRQLRPACLRRPPGRSHRQALPGRVPGLGLRQLRPAVVHHLAARHGRRQPDGEGAGGRRALGRCVRHRAVELPHHARAVVADRGRSHRPDPARRPARGDSRGAPRAGGEGGRGTWAPRSTTSSRSCRG